jgi:hypothetical protein
MRNDHLQSSHSSMRTLPNDETRLQLLNEAPGQRWSSCAEDRQCIMCESSFRGNEVVVREIRRSQFQLACPHCGSNPQFWVRCGNPLLDELVWADWERAITSYMEEIDSEGELATTG